MRKTKLTFKETKYYVNKEKKTIVCLLSFEVKDPENFIEERLIALAINKLYRDKYPWEFTSKGLAKCSDDDTFDEVLGKRIAESKAKKAAYKIAMRIRYAVMEQLSKLVDKNNAIYDNLKKNVQNEHEHLDKLLGE